MFFVIAKLAWMLAAPVTMLLGLAVLGALLLVLGARRLGRGLAVTGIGLLAVAGVAPVGAVLLRPLEDRFAPLAATLEPPDGIIVLGGSTDQVLTLGRGRVSIANAAERVTEAVALARRYPGARLVFSGGSGALGGSTDTEAADMRRLWIAMGVSEDRITLEDRSRNTDENVRFSKAIVAPQPAQRWVLVTSAFHMPRAVALFRANAWPVIPDPVDYHTSGTSADYRPSLAVADNWERLTLALHEWVGLVVYRLSGRTAVVLPER